VEVNVAGVTSAVKIERQLLRGLWVLFSPELQKERRQDAIHYLEAVNHGVVAGAERNQESFFGNPRPAVMDMNALAATRTAAYPAGAVVAGDHPGTQAGKISLVSDLPGVTGEAKAFLKLSLPAATKTPQQGLAGPI